jgi:hypothetical protein
VVDIVGAFPLRRPRTTTNTVPSLAKVVNPSAFALVRVPGITKDDAPALDWRSSKCRPKLLSRELLTVRGSNDSSFHQRPCILPFSVKEALAGTFAFRNRGSTLRHTHNRLADDCGVQSRGLLRSRHSRPTVLATAEQYGPRRSRRAINTAMMGGKARTPALGPRGPTSIFALRLKPCSANVTVNAVAEKRCSVLL